MCPVWSARPRPAREASRQPPAARRRSELALGSVAAVLCCGSVWPCGRVGRPAVCGSAQRSWGVWRARVASDGWAHHQPTT
eukprot:4165098-Prymnesium_polylepis.1